MIVSLLQKIISRFSRMVLLTSRVTLALNRGLSNMNINSTDFRVKKNEMNNINLAKSAKISYIIIDVL
jgi:hypothetical protein